MTTESKTKATERAAFEKLRHWLENDPDTQERMKMLQEVEERGRKLFGSINVPYLPSKP